MRHLPDEQSPAFRREAHSGDAAAALQEALAILGDNEEAVQTLYLAIASARRFGAWRERGKTNAVKLMHEVRIALYAATECWLSSSSAERHGNKHDFRIQRVAEQPLRGS